MREAHSGMWQWQGGPMRMATWNVNSIGARLPRLLPWLEERAPDVVALQETKCAAGAFPYLPAQALGYEALAAGDGRWNGVAILSKLALTDPITDLPGHPEARLAAARCGPLQVVSVYVPNGRSPDDEQFPYKLDWLASLRTWLDGFDPTEPLVIMGDFNVAPKDEDVWDIKAFTGSTHVTPQERAGIQALLDWGLTDVAARPGKGDRPFTYWDYRAGMFHKDLGMRIDLVLATAPVRVTDAYVDRDARKGKLPSDHAPLILDIEV